MSNKGVIVFYMGHPAHYHNVSILSKRLIEEGYKVVYIAREKDVLFKLLANMPYEVHFLPARKGNSKLSIILSVISREWKMYRMLKRIKPTMLFGTDIVITHLGKKLKIPAFVLNEDDAKEVPKLAHYGFKYSTGTFSPNCCDIDPYNNKKIGYEGYHELAYLRPEQFTPNTTVKDRLQKEGKGFAIIRFAQLTAHHDEGRKGITNELAKELIAVLEMKLNVYITSERPLSEELEPYRIQIDPREMHHALYYADLYIGDSQTMAAEAAVLGTPSIRFNDFVGKLGYLEELEHKYQLTYGIKTDRPDVLLDKVKELVNKQDIKEVWEQRRLEMLKQTIDVADFWFNFIDSYPESKKLIGAEVEQKG